MLATIQCLIDRDAKLQVAAADLTPHTDLYALGLTPYSAVRLLLTLEREFEVEFPRKLLERETMRSIDAIMKALHKAQSLDRLSAA